MNDEKLASPPKKSKFIWLKKNLKLSFAERITDKKNSPPKQRNVLKKYTSFF